MKKRIVALQAWNYFSEYYARKVGDLVKDHYTFTVTYKQDPKYLNKFDIIWSFFPQFPKYMKNLDKVVKTFWEPHELGWDKGKVSVVCSRKNVEIMGGDPTVKFASFGVDDKDFYFQKFPRGKVKVGWAGDPQNARKQYPMLRKMMKTLKEEVSFVPNLVKNRVTKYRGQYEEVSDMVAYYKGIHIYVCSSGREGFGLPLLEASACGRPVITFDVGIASELRKQGAGVLIVKDIDEMRKEILRLSKNPELIKKLGQDSLRVVQEHWLWSKFKDQWLSVFDSV